MNHCQPSKTAFPPPLLRPPSKKKGKGQGKKEKKNLFLSVPKVETRGDAGLSRKHHPASSHADEHSNYRAVLVMQH